jgi:hypothetical protein
MSHILEVDHSKARGSQRRIERAPDGRITSEEMAAPSPGQYEDLGRELAGAVDGEVRFDPGDLALYATDASNYRQVPIGVVIPRSAAAIATGLSSSVASSRLRSSCVAAERVSPAKAATSPS